MCICIIYYIISHINKCQGTFLSKVEDFSPLVFLINTIEKYYNIENSNTYYELNQNNKYESIIIIWIVEKWFTVLFKNIYTCIIHTYLLYHKKITGIIHVF